MNTKPLLLFATFTITLLGCTHVPVQNPGKVVRVAKLVIDPARLESYNAALKEEIEASVRVEPGVLSLFAVSEKGKPASITIFEIYANDAAYRAHIASPHFKKYKTNTLDMVKSLELVENVPILLETKTLLNDQPNLKTH